MHPRPSQRKFAWSFGPASVVAAAVGWAAGKHGDFAWDPAAISGTGVATATLAFFTAKLADSTSTDVAATRELATIEQKRFSKEDEPWLILGAARVYEETLIDNSDGLRPIFSPEHVETVVVNTGRGPATIINWAPYFQNRHGAEIEPSEMRRGSVGVLLGGTEARIAFETWDVGIPGRYLVRGYYSDRDQRRVICLGREPPKGWRVWLKERQDDDWWMLQNHDLDTFAIEETRSDEKASVAGPWAASPEVAN